MSSARIGRVTMKSGGADVRVMHSAKRSEVADNLLRGAGLVASYDANDPSDPIAAYVVFAVFKSGATSTGFQTSDDSPIPTVALPMLVAEGLRRDIITQTEAVNVVNRANGWDE